MEVIADVGPGPATSLATGLFIGRTRTGNHVGRWTRIIYRARLSAHGRRSTNFAERLVASPDGPLALARLSNPSISRDPRLPPADV